MSKFLCVLLFFVTPLHSQAQTKRIDDLQALLKNHPQEDTIRVNLLNDLSYQFIGLNYYTALQHAEMALNIANHLSFNKGMAVSNNWIALCYWVFGDAELAVSRAMSAIKLAEKERLYNILAESYRLLGATYTDQGELEQATLYTNKAEALCLKTDNWNVLLRVYVCKGMIQSDQKKYDSALTTFNKSLALAKEHNYTYYQPVIYCKIGTMFGIGNNPKRAMDYYNKGLNLARQVNNKFAEANVLSQLGGTLVREGNYNEGEKYLLQSQKLSRQLGLRVTVKQNLADLMNSKMRQGDHKEANHYMKAYYELKDSLLNETTTRHIIESETRYETDKKEQEIKLLVQEKRLEEIWRNGFLVISVVIAAAFIIIYRLQQLRNRKARQLLSMQEALNEKLRETDKLKSRFFANVSHELRTPLTLILAPLEEKLNSSNITAGEKISMKVASRNAHRLLALVNQLLDLSKLEANKMELSILQGDLKELVNVIAASFDSLAVSKKIKFEKHIHFELQDCWFDSDKIEKILNNILFNAFKFTPEGGNIRLYADVLIATGELRLTITDTGRGIAPEDKEQIFSPFFQSKPSDGHGGTGLGLALVKELIKLYEGTIQLSSVVDQGTSIYIKIPVTREAFSNNVIASEAITQTVVNKSGELGDVHEIEEEAEEVLEGEAEEIPEETILIVEDNSELRNFMTSFLESNYKVIGAGDGSEGYKVAVENIPTLIISDVMMPNIDGITLTDKIRTDERTSHIPIILLTAKSDRESRIEGLLSGADDYLSKPFSTRELKVRIANLIKRRQEIAAKYPAVQTISIPFAKEASEEHSLDEKFLMKVRKVVEDHLSDSTFSVLKMAESINLGRTQLFRKLKAISGVSPNEFINEVRLQHAAQMIKARTETLTQIGYAVGFSEQSYFAKRFRKRFGLSPSEYQLKYSETKV
jgi:signal transduction histidine kinase/DNA-binding response OmpR family regulator